MQNTTSDHHSQANDGGPYVGFMFVILPIVRLLAPKTFGPPDHWPPTQTIGTPGVDYWPPI